MSAATNDITAVLLAAGKGVRMQSELPKVLHPLNGTPLIRHVIDSVMAAGIRDIIVVVGYQGASAAVFPSLAACAFFCSSLFFSALIAFLAVFIVS